MPLNEGATNDILPFAPDGTEAAGDLMPIATYRTHTQRLRGHQPGIALRELENRVLRQLSAIAVGLGQYIANRYAAGVAADPAADDIEAGMAVATGSAKVRHTVAHAGIVWAGEDDGQLTDAIVKLIASSSGLTPAQYQRTLPATPTGQGGTADAITATYAPAITGLTDGLTLWVRAVAANTTATPTFAPGDTSPAVIVKGNNLPLASGDIAGAGHWLLLRYDATLAQWVLLNPAQRDSVPVGVVVSFAGTAAPSGWLVCNGAAISRTAYAALFGQIGTTFGVGDGSTTFELPDLRGVFVRGLDGARGLDVDRAGAGFGTYQADAFASHTHGVPYMYSNTGGSHSVPTGGTAKFIQNTEATGGAETRPKNVALNYIIKY